MILILPIIRDPFHCISLKLTATLFATNGTLVEKVIVKPLFLKALPLNVVE